MKHWIRIFVVALVLIGGTSLFGFWSIERFNNSLDTLIDMCNEPAVIPSTPLVERCSSVCEQKIEEECPVVLIETPPIETPVPSLEDEPAQPDPEVAVTDPEIAIVEVTP